MPSQKTLILFHCTIYWPIQFSLVQSFIQLFLTPWTATRQAALSSAPRACSNTCQSCRWCQPTISSFGVPFSSWLQSFQHQGLFQWVSSLHQVAKVSELQLQSSPLNEYSRLISFTIDWFDLLAVQRTLKSLLQHHSSKAPILLCSAFFMVQLSHPYMTTGKTIALTLFLSLVTQSCLTLATPWIVACQAPLFMGFSRQEYWSGCHFILQGIFLT